MGDDIEINVTETTNIIEITPQPNDQIVDIAVTDNAPNVEINVTPSVVEINVTRGSSTAIWGSIEGNLTDQSDLVTALGLKADLIDGKVPSTQLPSYVDDVIEVANYAALPTSGEVGKIYVTLDNNKIYRWSGSLYIEIAANQAIWGAITGNLGDQLDLQNALNTKEPTITAGTTSQYWRGDKSWQTLDKNAVGLGNVDNTSDLNKPISTATQTALNGKFNNPTGDTTQYIAGDGSLITFPISGQAGTIVREVRNTTGATLTKGTIVYISGATGNKATISKAIATGDSTSAQTFGLLQADISNNANGYVVVLGDLIGLDTSGITEGSQLYLSSTVAGAYTTTKQVAPAHLVYIGVVTRSHPSLGQIEVKIQNGYELDEIHDVSITSKANNQFLVYESASTLWKNKSLSTILGGTSSQFLKGDGSLDSTAYVPTARTLTINGTAYDLSANRSWTITAGVWGQITGILSDQTDLQTALDAKTPTARTLTINGTAYDLSANRSWTIPTHDAVTIGTANGLSLSTQVLSLGLSSASANGALSSTDWTTFNNKQGALTFTSPLVNTSGTVSIPAATSTVNGHLTSADWTTFNNKQGALNGTGFVKISGTTISYDNSTYALDNVVVKLSGSQTIDGSKTFLADAYLDNNIYLKKTGSWSNPANYSVIGGMTHGFFLSSGTNKHAYLDLFQLTQARQYSFPNQSGTFAMTSDIPTISGTTNYIPKITGTNTLGDSLISESAGVINVLGTIRATGGGTERYFQMPGYNSSNVAFRSNVGFSSSYNNFGILVNVNSNESGQGNTTIPSWSLNLGGNIPDQDSFTIERTNAGSFSFSKLLKISANGASAFSGNVTAPSFIGNLSGNADRTFAAFYNNGTTFITNYNNQPENTNQDYLIYNTSDAPRGGFGLYTVSMNKWSSSYGSMFAIDTEPSQGIGYIKSLYGGNWGAWKMLIDGSTDQTIGGIKTFSNNVKIGTTLPMILSNDTSENNLVNGIYYTTDNSGYGFAIGKIVSGTKTKQFVVRDSGNVLINSQSDNGYRLQVTGGISTTTNSSIAGTFSFINLENNSSKLSCSRFLAINDNGQNVGIGYNSDSVPVGAKLSVNGNAYFGGSVRAIGGFTFDYGAGIYAVNYTYSNVLLTGYDPSAGDFVDFYTAGSGSSNATKKIRILNNGTTTFYGNVYAPGFFNSSDIRLKKLIDYDLNVSDIKPITYLWKNGKDKQKHIGYSAQEVQKVMPDAVNEDSEGMLSVNYIEVLVAKIAQMEKEIELLKSK